MDKRGISGVVVTVILIGISVMIAAIVWVAINSLVSERLSGAESCFGVFERVTLNSRYTCYDLSENTIQFSISIKDIDVEEVLVSISYEGESRSFTITNEPQTIESLKNFGNDNEFGEDLVSLPGRNAGKTYVYAWRSDIGKESHAVEIAPVINGEQCGVSSSLYSIDNCKLLM